MISKEVSRTAKQQYLYEILEAKNVQAATALYAYAQFLNRHPLRYEYFPLYLKVFESNNQYAIDALIEDLVPESFFDMIIIPNHFVVKKMFGLLDMHKTSTLYEMTVRVLCGFIRRVYVIAEDGYRIYQLNVNDLNSLARNLDEEHDQRYPVNRVVLETLQYISELDNLNETDKQKLDVGRQANRIRGDFLDNNRRLNQAITEAVLQKGGPADLGIVPEQLQ